MDKKQRYIVPPKMSKAQKYGGFQGAEGWIAGGLLVAAGIFFMSVKQLWAAYSFAVPVVYVIMVWRIDDYSGADFFKAVLHYLWTPQTYVLTPLRKEDTDDE